MSPKSHCRKLAVLLTRFCSKFSTEYHCDHLDSSELLFFCILVRAYLAFSSLILFFACYFFFRTTHTLFFPVRLRAQCLSLFHCYLLSLVTILSNHPVVFIDFIWQLTLRFTTLFIPINFVLLSSLPQHVSLCLTRRECSQYLSLIISLSQFLVVRAFRSTTVVDILTRSSVCSSVRRHTSETEETSVMHLRDWNRHRANSLMGFIEGRTDHRWCYNLRDTFFWISLPMLLSSLPSLSLYPQLIWCVFIHFLVFRLNCRCLSVSVNLSV